MKKGIKHIAVTIAAVTVAMLGLVSLQIFLLMDSYHQKEQAFDRNVMNALNSVSQQIEKEEASSRIFSVAMEAPPLRNGAQRKFRKMTSKDSLHLPGAMNGSFSWIISDSAPKNIGKQMRVEVFHSAGVETVSSVVIRKEPKKGPVQQSFSYSYSTDDKEMRIRASVNDSAMIILRDTTKKRRGEIVSQVVDKLFLVETLPIEERLSMPRLDSMLKGSLASVGIDLPYAFRVTVGHHDSVRITNDTVFSGTSTRTPFTARLFPNDVISPRYELALFLPEKASFVLEDMALVIALSLVFISIVAGSFIYSIRVIIRQKRFAESIIDFINNMTHEFKTPISTIALASEAIANPEVLKSKLKVRKYNSLIADENNRMKHQVDTILQLAVLEQKEFELKIVPVDMHAVIGGAVANFTLPVEQRNGSITADLRAGNAVVRGDSVHLANIIHNLLDNAVKYSPAIPTIAVETVNVGADLVIRISDNGVGISAEDLKRIFDKYYRVPTGNTHDVKGFGLGLSYVKLMTEAHHGTIVLRSTAGKGTIAELTIPL